MATRTARTAWDGGLLDGSGQVELTTSGVGTFDVSWPRRSEDDAKGVTSPEELVAGAHSSCFAMQLSHEIAEAGGTPQTLEVTASVDFGPVAGGGHAVTGITLKLRGEVEGLDAAGFAKAAEAAKVGCPISQALKAVPISLEIVEN